MRVYESLQFPDPPADRPWIAINMIATIDGKILSGNRDEPVMDLGSKTDHQALRDLEAAADAVITGAETIRATPKIWYDSSLIRVAVTRSGNLPWDSRFFTDAPEQAVILAPETAVCDVPTGVSRWAIGPDGSFAEAMRKLRQDRGVRHMVLEGGSELNASFLAQDLVDEIFLTIAPKVKLGRDVPTIAGGKALDRSALQQYNLVSVQQVESELFLRYRRRMD